MWPFWESEEDRARREQEERLKRAQAAHASGCAFSVLGVLAGIVTGMLAASKTGDPSALVLGIFVWSLIGYGLGRFWIGPMS